MTASRFDIRVIFVFAVAVMIAYWLILPKENKNNEKQQLGHHKNEVTVTKSLEQREPFTALKEMKGSHVDEREDSNKVIKLQAELERSHDEAKDLQVTLKEKNDQIEGLKHMLDKKQKAEQADVNKKKNVNVFTGHKLVHFDMKGAAPKINYLRKILPLIKDLGATGLLVEYEDMYPYQGELKLLQAKDAYSEKEIIEFLDLAKELQLTVIPLVQTFGHMEFVLKHKKFAHLRETSKITNSVCPLNPGSLKLIQSIIKDILRLHPDAKWLHLGGDEVWNLKTCDQCKASSKTHSELYLHHMLPVFKYLKTETKGKVKPIIWDDMMRKWSIENLTAIAKVVEPMIWAYVPNLENYENFPDGMWQRYQKTFSKVWIASSFKGAKESVTNYVPIQQHINNHLSWLKIISTFPENFEVLGIAMTGWSRYDHYASLCELFPVAIPSLAFCLSVLKTGEFNTKLQESVSKSLGFKKMLATKVKRFKSYVIQDGNFPGHDVFRIVSEFEKAYGWFLSGRARNIGWAREYQVKNKHLSYYQLEYASNAGKVCSDMLKNLKPKAKEILSKYFSNRIVNEWIDDKINSAIKEANSMKNNVDAILKKENT